MSKNAWPSAKKALLERTSPKQKPPKGGFFTFRGFWPFLQADYWAFGVKREQPHPSCRMFPAMAQAESPELDRLQK